MTSEANDAPTRAFFQRHNHFGYTEDDIFFFQQGMMPAFALDGQMLLGVNSGVNVGNKQQISGPQCLQPPKLQHNSSK